MSISWLCHVVEESNASVEKQIFTREDSYVVEETKINEGLQLVTTETYVPQEP